jgi:hypothetical protein
MSTSIDIQLHSNQLSTAVKAEMWRIYSPYYHYSEDYFYSRISNNTHYALYRKEGRLVGFTGLRLKTITIDGEENFFYSKRQRHYFTIYFGQTVITAEVRSTGIINKTGILLLKKYWKTLFTHRTVFWADALSYRAYLVFAKNLLAYYPSVKEDLPAAILQLRDKLGSNYYADRFCSKTGTVRKDSYLIRDSRVEITSDKLNDLDISYYAQANPKYKEGYGLLTMGPASWKNILFMIGKFFRKWLESKLTPQPSGPQTASV